MVIGALPSASRLLRQPLAQRLDARDVRAIVLEHVRHGVPRLRQPVRGRPANAAHRLALDRSPFAEVGQRSPAAAGDRAAPAPDSSRRAYAVTSSIEMRPPGPEP